MNSPCGLYRLQPHRPSNNFSSMNGYECRPGITFELLLGEEDPRCALFEVAFDSRRKICLDDMGLAQEVIAGGQYLVVARALNPSASGVPEHRFWLRRC